MRRRWALATLFLGIVASGCGAGHGSNPARALSHAVSTTTSTAAISTTTTQVTTTPTSLAPPPSTTTPTTEPLPHPATPITPQPTVPTNTPEIADLRQELQGAETGLSEDSFRLQQDNQTLSSDIQDCSQGQSQGVQSPIACSDEASASAAVSADSSRVQNDESEIQNYQRELRAARGDSVSSGATYRPLPICQARSFPVPNSWPISAHVHDSLRSSRIVACRSLLS